MSFLCDRETTNVAKSQPGFISFIVLPLFSTLTEYMPSMKFALDGAKNSKALWETYTETEEDQLVYIKKTSPLSHTGSSLESLPEQDEEAGSP